ncbi:hypothetical protein [uncultured Flavobacterium sp.]|uniref:hypothetical protein n=1 Tax=uncultured Flavobacterium sp. TaxID=165435 RepID=UPI0030EB3C5B|tara:strand:+ start:349 stop:516 length:168 start_codon:yes stop_codon:yes gene_type:complete
MYTKLEIIEIFMNCKNIEEFEVVCAAFFWDIDNNFMKRSDFLHRLSNIILDKLQN